MYIKKTYHDTTGERVSEKTHLKRKTNEQGRVRERYVEKNIAQVSSIRVVCRDVVVVLKSNKKLKGNCFVKHLEYVIFKEIIKFSTP